MSSMEDSAQPSLSLPDGGPSSDMAESDRLEPINWTRWSDEEQSHNGLISYRCFLSTEIISLYLTPASHWPLPPPSSYFETATTTSPPGAVAPLDNVVPGRRQVSG